MSIFYYLVMAGLLCNMLGIIFIWPVLNILGFILMTVGAFKLSTIAKPFKTLLILSMLAVPFSILSLFILLTNTTVNEYTNTINYIAVGINVFFIIYDSYYFTAGINNYAASINMAASVRNNLTTWVLYGIAVFLYFMAYSSSLLPIIIFAIKVALMMFTVYYMFTLLNIKKALFQ